MSHPSRPPDADYVAQQRALLARLDELWTRGVLRGEMIEQAREGDHVLAVDFEGERVTLTLRPRTEFIRAIPTDTHDEAFAAMLRGQPPTTRGETVAAWLLLTEWQGDEPLVEVHGPVRAWRKPRGNA